MSSNPISRSIDALDDGERDLELAELREELRVSEVKREMYSREVQRVSARRVRISRRLKETRFELTEARAAAKVVAKALGTKTTESMRLLIEEQIKKLEAYREELRKSRKSRRVLKENRDLLRETLVRINDGFKYEAGHSDSDRHCTNIHYWNKIICKALKGERHED